MTAWRIDNVFLIVLGFALIPISIGRWTLGRTEGILVLMVYAFYLALIARVAVS
jgi:Ca2+/Na+ antiporter